MNRPERYEAIWLDDDEEKVTFEKDMKMTDAGTFKIMKEDHTLGNILRMHLLENKNVLFAGYKIPHPLYHELKVKVRTQPGTTPHKEMKNSLRTLKTIFKEFKKSFNQACEEKKSFNDGDMEMDFSEIR